MTQRTLIDRLLTLCEEEGLSYDGTPPIEVSPGIWRFLAVEKSPQCVKHGHCRQMSHYAMSTTNNQLKLC